MKGFGPETFGEVQAEHYDERSSDQMEAETLESVEALVKLAGGGSVLELAIGTGRVALPLAARGLMVQGIEASEKMVEKLRAKPGGDAIPVVIGDMAEAQAEGTFDLVYLVFNTIFNLTTQDAQRRCFQNAAQHLTEKGVFVIETVVPDLSVFTDGQAIRGQRVSKAEAGFEILIHDAVAQTVDCQRIRVTETGTRLVPHFFRYVWPSELDLMAQLAGLELRERWGWWDGSPFTAESTSHVSVYGRA